MTQESDLAALLRARRWAADGEARRLRLQANLSLADLAETVRVGRSTLHRWENGSRRPAAEPGVRYGRLLAELQELMAAAS